MREKTMPAFVQNKMDADGTRLGEYAPMQPLSGVKCVDETFAVSGLGRGGYVRKEETSKAFVRS